MEELDKIKIFGNQTYTEVFGHSLKLYELPTHEAFRQIVTLYERNATRIPFIFKIGLVICFGGLATSIGSLFTSFTLIMSLTFLMLSIFGIVITAIGIHQFYLINFIRHEYCMSHVMNNEFVDEISDTLRSAIEDEETRNNFEGVFESVKIASMDKANRTKMRILTELFEEFDREETPNE